jgi:adenylate kinase family enzyme
MSGIQPQTLTPTELAHYANQCLDMGQLLPAEWQVAVVKQLLKLAVATKPAEVTDVDPKQLNLFE